MSHFKQRLDLLKYPPFFTYVISCLCASFGNGLGYVALSWYVVSKYNSINAVIILVMCFWLPNVLLGPIFGVFADRFDRKSINIFSCWARALVFGALFVYLHFGSSLYVIYSMMLLVGTFFSLFFSGVFAFVRELVPEKDLMHANSSIDIAYEVGNVTGMGCAGLIIAAFTIKMAMLINGLTFLLVMICIMAIPRSALCHGSSEPTPKMQFVKDFKDGIRYLLSRRALMGVYSIQLLLGLVFLTAPVILVPFSKTILHANVTQFGRIEAMLSLGVVTGGIIVPWIADKMGFSKTMLFFTPALAIAFLFFGYNRSIPIADALYYVVGFVGSVWPVILTKAQSLTSIDYQGRVQSTFNSISGSMTMLCYISVGGLGHVMGISHLYWIEVAIPMIAILMLLCFNRALSEAT